MIRDSMSDIRRLVQRHGKLLQDIARNTRALRKSHSVHAPASILSADDASESILNQLIDSKGSQEKKFETVILSTKVYSTAFSGALEPVAEDKQSNDARTTTDTEFANHSIGLRPMNATMDARNTSEVSILAINDPKVQSSIRSLKVITIKAVTQCNCTALLDVDLSLKEGMWIEHVQQLTKERYYGQLRESQLQGQFSRKQAIVIFRLSSILRIRTTRNFY